MKFEDRDVMDWLHETRKKNEDEREKRRLSGKEWLKEVTRDAEKILGHKIPKVKDGNLLATGKASSKM